MSGSRRRLAPDDEAVSEVVGYILTFAVSFFLLIGSLSTFGIIAEEGREIAATAQFQDIANRVSSAVLELFSVAATINATIGVADSGSPTTLRYERPLDIPSEFRGFQYRIELGSDYVFVNSTDGQVRVNATTLRSGIVLAPTGLCDSSYIVCHVTGTVPTGSSRATVTYEYLPPSTNEIHLS